MKNATTETAYDKEIWAAIETDSRKRISDEKRVKLAEIPTQEHGAAKKSIIRDLAAPNDPLPVKQTVVKTYQKGDPELPKGKGDRRKGGRKGSKVARKGARGRPGNRTGTLDTRENAYSADNWWRNGRQSG